MNREEFIHQIDNITEVDILNAFCNYMALYNLYEGICGSENMKISKSSEPGSFDLNFKEQSSAEKTYSTFNEVLVKIYGIEYHVNCELDGNLLRVKLITPDMV